MEARVFAQCWMPFGKRQQICCEQIEITASETSLADAASLIELFRWSWEQFEHRMRGSAIHRIGYERWSRNIAVALGNAPTTPQVVEALEARRDDKSQMVREHIEWALRRHRPAA